MPFPRSGLRRAEPKIKAQHPHGHTASALNISISIYVRKFPLYAEDRKSCVLDTKKKSFLSEHVAEGETRFQILLLGVTPHVQEGGFRVLLGRHLILRDSAGCHLNFQSGIFGFAPFDRHQKAPEICSRSNRLFQLLGRVFCEFEENLFASFVVKTVKVHFPSRGIPLNAPFAFLLWFGVGNRFGEGWADVDQTTPPGF